jgi:peptidoglycan-N-acetylglucosamine deacetylase
MGSIKVWGLALAVAAGAWAPGLAQKAWAQDASALKACTPTVPAADALGVSRVAEIDTSSGPLFGAPYKEPSFLADGEVVLTFDDGPLRAYTLPVLDALAAHCAKATFFLVGRMAVADPEMVKEYARRGHTVGTHTWSHANLRGLTPLKARAEIELGFSAVQQAMGKPLAPFFRFPFLGDPKSMIMHLQGRQIGIFSIDVDSKDFRTRDPGTVQRKVMADLARAKKGIILFHDIQSSTARALPGLLTELKAKGYRIVHMQPKAEATTVAEYDDQARQELDRRRVKVADQPLAKRSLTWPVAAASRLPVEPVAIKASATARPPARPAVRSAAAPKQGQDWAANFLVSRQMNP